MIRIHIGLVTGTMIRMGLIRPIFNENEGTLIYVLNTNNAIFNLHADDKTTNISNSLKFISYLKHNVCEDGLKLQQLLNNKDGTINDVLVDALPQLSKTAVKPRIHKTQFTPQSHRVRIPLHRPEFSTDDELAFASS